MTRDGIPDVLVSNSQSNNVMLLPGVGGGFFNDQNPRVIDLPTSPGPIYPFGPGVVVLNPESNTVTLISNFMGTSPITRTVDSGGSDPVAALVFRSDNGFDNLIVANNGDGHVVLLEGSAEGLILADIQELLSPTALAFSSFTGGLVEVYAATEGSEAATLLTLTFLLGGETGGMPKIPGLQPLRDAALPLIATLLTLTIETSTAEFDSGSFDGEASAAISFLPETSNTTGQSLLEPTGPGEGEGGDEEEPNELQRARSLCHAGILVLAAVSHGARRGPGPVLP